MTTVINLKTDKEVKEQAQKLAKKMGFSLSSLINAYLRHFLRNKEVYFSLAPKMTAELENLLGKIEFDIQRRKNLSKPVTTKTELQEHLRSL